MIPQKTPDITGKEYGFWTVLSYAGCDGQKATWNCRCKCGTEKVVSGYHLRRGSSKCCGCEAFRTKTAIPFSIRNKKYQAKYRLKTRIDRAKKLIAWRKKNPSRVQILKRRHNYRCKYGIEVEDAEKMLADQAGLCAICKMTVKLGGKSGAKLDHCHTTGRNRGILCSRCNTSLGGFRDDPVILAAAIEYLKG